MIYFYAIPPTNLLTSHKLPSSNPQIFSDMEGVVTLSAEQVTSILSTSELICAIENGLANFSNGTEGGVVQPVRSVVKVPKPAEADSDG